MSTETTEEAAGPSISDALEAQFDKAETSSTPEPAQSESSTANEAPETAVPERKGPARAPDGKFAPSPKQTTPGVQSAVAPAVATEEPATNEAPPAAVQPRAAPQALSPALREDWSRMSPAGQEALLKREGEVSQALRATAQARKFEQQFAAVLKPYAGKLTAPPLERVGSLLQTADRLENGTPEEKVELLAQMIQGFGVDVGLLDGRLTSGQPMPAPYRDPRVDVLEQRLEQMTRGTQEQKMRAAESTLQAFARTHPHFEQVRGRMATIFEALLREEGVEPDLETVYNTACWSHPEISKAMQGQVQAQGTASAATQRARAAGSSVRTNPAPVGGASAPKSISGLLEQHWPER